LSSHEGKDRESLMNELRGFKAEREKEIDTRKKIDQELKGVNITVQQKVRLLFCKIFFYGRGQFAFLKSV